MSYIPRSFFLILFTCIAFLHACDERSKSIPDLDFTTEWLFHNGETPGAEVPSFDDSGWRQLDLPHDWAIEGPFSRESNLRTGGLPVHGTGWYRKHFTVDRAHAGKRVSVEFDGAMNNAHVWLNGEFIGNRPYGYIGFEFDLTPFIKFGGENVIAVRLSPEDISSRWYPGAGIYRNVRLKINDPVHIPQWGTYLTSEVSENKALVNISIEVVNTGEAEAKAMLETSLFDREGNLVATTVSEISIGLNGRTTEDQQFEISNPVLWDLENPYLYTAVTRVSTGGRLVDEYTTEFGIRSIEFTADEGFKLNGERVKFQGVCMHHDLGSLGSAVNYRATERQMEIMQSMGVNALRTSHNPPSPEMLKVCDRLGILVQVEAFDEWQIGKVINGYNKYFDEWHERDLRDMIRRDRNHPSVIMWSIGNEILEQNEEDGWKLAKHLSDICHDEDPTRPTTAGFNYYPAPFENKLAYQIDVVGLNYWPLNYRMTLDNNPGMIVYGSETSSQTSSRGVYHLPIEPMERRETHQVSSYDAIVGPPWAYPPDVEFEQQHKVSESLGEFMWTGFDYLGEPTPYAGRDNSTPGRWSKDWPSRSSYFAPVDLSGFPKDRYYLYQSNWTKEPMVHVLPHWNWEGMEGEMIPVFSYTNCEEVELYVNGKSAGRKVKGVDYTEIPAEFHEFEKGMYKTKYRLSWEVPYQPGSVKVVAYNGGEAVAEKEIKTAGDPAQITLSADRKEIAADGKDLSFITVRIEDKDGNFCPLANNLVKFNVTGEGEIAAVGNGDATSQASFQADNREAFNGLCLLILKSIKDGGKIKVVAESADLESAMIEIITN